MLQFQGSTHHFAQLSDVYWLGNEVEGPGFERADCRFRAAMGGNYCNGDMRVITLNFPDQFNAIAIRHRWKSLLFR